MSLSSAPITQASLADAKLDNTQRRLAFLWSAAHSPLAVQAPLVAAQLLRSLRLVAFQEDCTLAASHTQTNMCSQCCQLHVPGLNATVRVEASANRRRKERRRRRSKRMRADAKSKESASGPESGGVMSDGAPSAQEGSESDAAVAAGMSTPRKRRRLSGASAAVAAMRTPVSSPPASVFMSPFAQPGAAASAAGSATAAAAASSGSSASAHALVIACQSCGHRDRWGGQTARQKQLLHDASTDIEALAASAAANSSEARQLQQQQQQLQQQAAEAAVAARENTVKQAKLLHSLQSQAHAAPKPVVRASLPSLAMLSQQVQMPTQTQSQVQMQSLAQRPAAPAAQTHAALSAVTDPAAVASAPAKPFSFSASGSAAAKPAAPSASAGAAVGAPAKPFSFSAAKAAAPAASTPTGAPFSFSRSAAPAQPGRAGAGGAGAAGSKGAGARAVMPFAAAGAASMMQGIQIIGGIKAAAPATPAGKGFSFTKQKPGANNQRKSR